MEIPERKQKLDTNRPNRQNKTTHRRTATITPFTPTRIRPTQPHRHSKTKNKKKPARHPQLTETRPSHPLNSPSIGQCWLLLGRISTPTHTKKCAKMDAEHAIVATSFSKAYGLAELKLVFQAMLSAASKVQRVS